MHTRTAVEGSQRPPKHSWREAWGEQPLSCADRPKAAGPDVLDTDAHPAPRMGKGGHPGSSLAQPSPCPSGLDSGVPGLLGRAAPGGAGGQASQGLQ